MASEPVAAPGMERPEIPPHSLVLLIGPAGAGKSTWAASHFRADQVVSSDGCRAMVAGDAADQSATADAFRVLHIIVDARMRRGLLTVVDATNLRAGARGTLVRYARRAGRPAVAIVFDVSLDRCLQQNARRTGRPVPDAVVRRHHAQLQTAKVALPDEAFAETWVLGD